MATKSKAAPAAKAPTKSEIMAQLSTDTGISKKDAGAVLASLAGMMGKSLKKSGVFQLPGLLKVKVVTKPATKARKGVNPFTGAEMMFKAKPARKVVKVLPLKALKDMV
jgi:nucleoid DNA-binding protein